MEKKTKQSAKSAAKIPCPKSKQKLVKPEKTPAEKLVTNLSRAERGEPKKYMAAKIAAATAAKKKRTYAAAQIPESPAEIKERRQRRAVNKVDFKSWSPEKRMAALAKAPNKANLFVVTDDMWDDFLFYLSDTANATYSATAAGFARPVVYERRRKDPAFEKLYNEALERGIDRLEERAHDRAFDGVNEPVFYQGKICGYVTRFSDSLTMFLLAGHREKYRRSTQDVNIAGRLKLNDTSDADLDALIAEKLAKISDIGKAD